MTGVAEIKRITDAGARAKPMTGPLRIVVPIDRQTTEPGSIESWPNLVQRHALFLSRASLSLVFFWFGLLKIANLSPVVNLLQNSMPLLAHSPYLQLLGLAEIGIGCGLLVTRLTKTATIIMILHLLGTFSLFLLAPRLMFAPAFPVLTMDGEFVLKNIVLLTAALVIMSSRPRR